MFSEKPEVQLAVIRLHSWKPALPWEMEQYPHRRILPAASRCLSLWPQATTALIWSIFFPIYLKCALSILKLCSSKGNSGALFCGSIRYKMEIIFCFKIDSLWFFRHFGSLMPVLSMENVLCILFIGGKICMWCSAPTYSATDFTGSFSSSGQVLRDMRWRAPGDGRFLLVAFRGFYCTL